MSQGYEYLVVAGDSSYLRSHATTAAKHTAQLNELAAEGWELTSTSAMEAVGFTIAVLAKVPGSLVTQAELLEQVWGRGMKARASTSARCLLAFVASSRSNQAGHDTSSLSPASATASR